MRTTGFFTVCLTVLAVMTACADGIGNGMVRPGQEIEVRLAVSGTSWPDGLHGNADENTIGELKAYIIEGGVLKAISDPQPGNDDGVYVIGTDGSSGMIYLVANAASVEGLSSAVPGKTTSEELLDTYASMDDMQASGLVMTGTVSIGDAYHGTADVKMYRSVARIDVSSFEKDVQVLSVSIGGLSEYGRLFPGRQPGPVQPGRDFHRDFSSAPLANGREVLLYVPEQAGGDIEAEVIVSASGGLSRLSVLLPQAICRNTVYNISVHGNGAGLDLKVSDGEWQPGTDSSSRPELSGLVDVRNSYIPEGVSVNEGRDTVYISHHAVQFNLALLAGPGSTVSVSGADDNVDISVVPAARDALVHSATVSVSAARRHPGIAPGIIYLDIHDGNIYSGRVVLVFMENPVKISGLMKLDSDGRCDFGRYIDGEIALMSLPQDKMIEIVFPEDESRWMQAVGAADGGGQGNSMRQVRLLAGWKPNDPNADGREQHATVVISDVGGSSREEYHISRINWGLPVVKIGETWWTMYNLRGRATSFGDQITCGNSPADRDGLFELLQTMPDEELLELMGDQYQGGNADGLPLRHDGNAFYHEGMMSSAGSFGTADPSMMVPAGYTLPSYDDFAFLAANDNHNIGGVGERSYMNRQGERIDVRIVERKVSFFGKEYGTVAFYEFMHEGNRWVLYGLGHQWNTEPGMIAVMQQLMATYGDASRSWLMEGYASDDRPGQNWLKYVAQNNTKTRTIRCVKTPVEYIYD